MNYSARASATTGTRVAVFDAAERRAYEQELLAARQRAEESDARSRSLVRTLQHTLMPPVPPIVEGLDIVAASRPAGDGDEVGGDFYDVFQLGVDDWIVAVGDLTGKGIQAATGTALVRHSIRAAAVARHRGSAHGLAYRLLDDVMTYQAGPASDDIVILGIHVPS